METATKNITKEFEMTDEQFKTLIESCQPVPMIALQCGEPVSPQKRANDAWQALGEQLGFDYTTVRSVQGKGQKFFTATTK